MQHASSDFSLAQRFITAGAAAWGDDDDYDALASVSILGGADSPQGERGDGVRVEQGSSGRPTL